MSDLVTTFELWKSTENTYRYKETPEKGQAPIIGSLYIQKWALNEEPPNTLKLTIEAE